MITAVDTNILLDIPVPNDLTGERTFARNRTAKHLIGKRTATKLPLSETPKLASLLRRFHANYGPFRPTLEFLIPQT